MVGRQAMWRLAGLLAIGAALVSLGARDAGAAEERRSGIVVGVDRATSTLLLQVGPASMTKEQQMAFPPTRIAFTPETSVMIVDHSVGASASTRPVAVPSTRVSSDPEALRPGAYATVVFDASSPEPVASRIELIADPTRQGPTPPSTPGGLSVSPK
jgi:hypothetical protein